MKDVMDLGPHDVQDRTAHLRQNGAHLALRGDDEGESVGVLFLEDAIEARVGVVRDVA